MAASKKMNQNQKEDSSVPTSTFEHLPNEVKFKIFDYLDPKTHLEARRACKAWLNISNEVRKQRVTLVPGGISLVFRPPRADPKKIHTTLSKLTLTEVDSIRFRELNVDLPTATVAHLPRSNRLIIHAGNSKATLVNVLQAYCTNYAKSLIITTSDPLASLAKGNREFWTLPMIMACLNSLSIGVAGQSRNSSEFKDSASALTTFMATAQFPVLTTFSVRLDYFDTPENGVIIKIFEPAMIKFLDSYGRDLKEFRLIANGINTSNSGQTIITCLEKIPNVEKLKIVCESDSSSQQQAMSFSEELNKRIQESMPCITQLELLIQTNFFDENTMVYVTEFNHNTLRALGSRLTSLRYMEHSVKGLESWLHAASKSKSFPDLTTLTLGFDKTALENEDPFQELSTSPNYFRLPPCVAVRTLTLDVETLSQAGINWILRFFPNLQDLVLDCTVYLHTVKALVAECTGTTPRKLKYIIIRGAGGDSGRGAVDPRIKHWCLEQPELRYFRSQYAPPQIEHHFYDYYHGPKTTRHFAYIQLPAPTQDSY